MKILFSALLFGSLLVITAAAAIGVSPDEYSRLLAERAHDPAEFASKDLDYKLGRIADGRGETALAISCYQSAAERGGGLAPFALMHLARIARSTGNVFLEKIYLSELAVRFPDSIPAEGSVERSGRASIEMNDAASAVRILTYPYDDEAQLRPSRSATRDDRRRIDEMLGEALYRSGRIADGLRLLNSIVDDAPDLSRPDDASVAAVKLLDRIQTPSGENTPQIAAEIHNTRGGILQADREFALAKVHFDAVIAADPTSEMAANAIFQIGRGYALQLDFVEALKWFERILEQHSDKAVAKDALLQAAAAYSRVGKPKEAEKRYQHYIELYPTDEKLDRAYLNVVDVERDLGQDSDALRWTQKTRNAFNGKLPATLADLAELRIYISRDEFENALTVIQRLRSASELGGNSPGGASASEVAFLEAYSNEMLKRYDEAADKYLSINDGRDSYFGGLANARLKEMEKGEGRDAITRARLKAISGLTRSGNEQRRAAGDIFRLGADAALTEKAKAVFAGSLKAIPSFAKDSPPSSPKLAADLYRLGIYDEAAAVTQRGDDDDDIGLFEAGGRSDIVIAIAEPMWTRVPADIPLELLPRRDLRLLYPLAFTDEIKKACAERGVDPRFLLALMRQESRFDPQARSYAAARGPMQFITPTALKIAGDLGRDHFSSDELYDPGVSMLFGAEYVRQLFNHFPGQPEAVAAGYNGGEENVKRWLARSGSNLPERYMTEIVYSQSKDYAEKVLANYRVYKYLYAEDLTPIEN